MAEIGGKVHDFVSLGHAPSKYATLLDFVVAI
jgi:hypothetical protein